MTLTERIDQDLIAAIKGGDAEKLSTLRMVRSALKNKQIELRRELEEADVIAVLQREVKQRREAAAEYEKGNRPELAEKEGREADLLQAYLPAEMSDDELTAIVDTVIADIGTTSVSDMGKVMGAVMGKVAGRASGARISVLVRTKLGA